MLCNLRNLEKIILSGEGMQAYEVMAPHIDRALRQHVFSSAAADCDLVMDAVDDDLWARGAACLVIQAAAGVSPS